MRLVALRSPLAATAESARISWAPLTPSVRQGPCTVRSLPLPLMADVSTRVVAVIDFAVGSLPPSPRRMGDAVERSQTVSALAMLFISRMLGALMLSEVVPNRIGSPFERSTRAVDITFPRLTDTGSR